MKNEVTVKLTNDNEPVYIYFIDGVHYHQKGFSSEKEAFEAGLKKLKELKKAL